MEKVMEYILATNEYRSFSKAAEHLFISQPALSAIIKKEETKLGVEIFDRNYKPLKLTGAGEKYIAAANKIKAIEQKMLEDLAVDKSKKHRKLTICSYAFLISNFLQDFTSDFAKSREGVEVELWEKRTEDALPLLQKMQVDFVITTHARKVKNCTFEPLMQEKIIIAVPAHYEINERLRKYGLSYRDIVNGAANDERYPVVSLSYFGSYPFIIHVKTKEMYRRARVLFKNAQINPRIMAHMDDFFLMYFVAMAGQGIVFIREGMVKYMDPSDKLVFYKLDDPTTSYNVNVYYHKNNIGNALVQQFLECCRKHWSGVSK